jgi:hypothetical protein
MSEFRLMLDGLDRLYTVMGRETAGQRCPRCGRGFRVLEDEQGTHECPRCGYFPRACKHGPDRDECQDCWLDEQERNIPEPEED